MSNHSRGSILASLEGGVAGLHPPEPARSVLVGPSTSNEFNTIKAALFPIACWRVDDIRFEFDSSFLSPDIADEMTALAKLVKRHTRVRQKPPMSVFGHADPVGNDNYNKQLSGRRAQVIYGLLTRDTALWEDLYSHSIGKDQWGLKSIQTMLKAVGHDPGAIDGVQGQKTTAAVKSFQQAQGLATDGIVGPQTRTKLFQVYMDAICQDEAGQPFKAEKSDFLAQGADPDGKGDYQGCSEFNPLLIFSQQEEQQFASDQTQRNAENAPNRRVVVFLFRPGVQVNPGKWPCPRAKEGVGGCKKRFWSDGEQRRSKHLPDQRREFDQTQDTFACRFYQRISDLSPCERLLPPVPRIECVTWDGWRAALARYVILLPDGTVEGLGDEDFKTDEQGCVQPQHIPLQPFTLFVFPPEKVQDKDPDFNVVHEYLYKREKREFKLLQPDPDTEIQLLPHGEGLLLPDVPARKKRYKVVCDLSLVVLQPALGLPGPVADGFLDVLVLTTKAVATLNQDLAPEFFLSCLRSQPWDKEAQHWSKTSLRWEGNFQRFAAVEAAGTGELRPDDQGMIKDLLARLSPKVAEAYQPWGLDTVFRIRFKRPEGATSQSNLINLQGEDVALHLVLRDMQFWPQDWPMYEEDWPANWPPFKAVGKKNAGFRMWSENKKSEFLRLFHPFYDLGNKEGLEVAHITDVHLNARWELFALTNQPFKNHINNYNQRYLEISADANQKADLVILTGDIIDFNRGLTDEMVKNQHDDLTKYVYNANWLLFYEKLLEVYEKPTFTVLGNHDYLINPYPQFMVINVTLLGIGVDAQRMAFANDLNLTTDEVGALVRNSPTENFQKNVGVGDAQTLIRAMDESDYVTADSMIEQHAPELLTRSSGCWYATADSATWYFLALNPFSDYHVAHQDKSFLMIDWGKGGENVARLLLPRPTQCLSSQWDLINAWLDRAAPVRTLCLHAPVMQPTPKMGNWYIKQARIMPHSEHLGDVLALTLCTLPPNGNQATQRELGYGAVEEGSLPRLWQELHRRLKQGKFPLQVVLAGHSHANKVLTLAPFFDRNRRRDPNRGIVRLLKQKFGCDGSVEDFQWGLDQTVFLITTSGGPIGEDEDFAARVGAHAREPMKELVPPGYRLVSFQDPLKTRGVFPCPTVDYEKIRPEVRDTGVDGSFIRKFQGSQAFGQHALIGEVTANSTIQDVSDGVTVGIKRIPQGVTLRIGNNDGTIVILENQGKIIVEDNDDILRIEHNQGEIEIQQNDDDIAVQKNDGRMVIFNSRPRHSLEQTEVNDVHIHENSGSIRIESNTGGVVVRSTVFIKRNLASGRVDVNRNDDQVTVGLNQGTVQINKNDDRVTIQLNRNVVTVQNNDDTIELEDNRNLLNIVFNASGVVDDADILVRKMSEGGAIVINQPGNKGNLHIPKGQRSRVTVMPGAATGDIEEEF